jgi:hypothetical protein
MADIQPLSRIHVVPVGRGVRRWKRLYSLLQGQSRRAVVRGKPRMPWLTEVTSLQGTRAWLSLHKPFSASKANGQCMMCETGFLSAVRPRGYLSVLRLLRTLYHRLDRGWVSCASLR